MSIERNANILKSNVRKLIKERYRKKISTPLLFFQITFCYRKSKSIMSYHLKNGRKTFSLLAMKFCLFIILIIRLQVKNFINIEQIKGVAKKLNSLNLSILTDAMDFKAMLLDECSIILQLFCKQI